MIEFIKQMIMSIIIRTTLPTIASIESCPVHISIRRHEFNDKCHNTEILRAFSQARKCEKWIATPVGRDEFARAWEIQTKQIWDGLRRERERGREKKKEQK